MHTRSQSQKENLIFHYVHCPPPREDAVGLSREYVLRIPQRVVKGE